MAEISGGTDGERGVNLETAPFAHFGPSHRGVPIHQAGPWGWFWFADSLCKSDSAATLAEAMAQIDAALGVAA